MLPFLLPCFMSCSGKLNLGKSLLIKYSSALYYLNYDGDLKDGPSNNLFKCSNGLTSSFLVTVEKTIFNVLQRNFLVLFADVKVIFFILFNIFASYFNNF